MGRPSLLCAALLVVLLAPSAPALAQSGAEEPVPLTPPAVSAAPAPAPAATSTPTAPRSVGPARDSWLAPYVPEPLRAPGPRGLRLWQWLALPVWLLLAFGLGRLLSSLSLLLVRPLARRTEARWDDLLLERLPGPLALAWALFAARLALPALALTRSAEGHLTQTLRGGFIVTLFWALLRTVDLTGDAVRRSPWAQVRPAVASLLPLTMRMAKVALVPLGVIAVLAEFGYPVASLIAGLGIGGLALALAAQKTVENLFGSVSIGLDQPFRVGDYVRLEDGTAGDVESIGLRSTQLRTLDRTVVSIPNGKLADQRIETFGRRDRIRLHLTLPLVYGTTHAQARAVLEGLERTLRAHPLLHTEELVVALVGLGDSGMNVEVMAWFQTTSLQEFRPIRQQVLLQFLEIIERAGTRLAHPTRTLHIASGPLPPARS